MSGTSSLARTPQDALEVLLVELDEQYYPFFARATRRLLWSCLVLQNVALLSGFVTAIMAAVVTDEAFRSYSWIRVALICLPALGAALSTVMVQARLQERLQLREEGRRAIQEMLNEGRRRFASATKSEEFSEIHQDLNKQIDELFRAQAITYLGLLAAHTKVSK
jgi:hypothetical protein